MYKHKINNPYLCWMGHRLSRLLRYQISERRTFLYLTRWHLRAGPLRVSHSSCKGEFVPLISTVLFPLSNFCQQYCSIPICLVKKLGAQEELKWANSTVLLNQVELLIDSILTYPLKRSTLAVLIGSVNKSEVDENDEEQDSEWEVPG